MSLLDKDSSQRFVNGHVPNVSLRLMYPRNAEQVKKLNDQIEEQRSRQAKAEEERQGVEDLLRGVSVTLWNLCSKHRVSGFVEEWWRSRRNI